MPTYEVSLMLRQMTRPELISALKRSADTIFAKGGFIRKIDNLGLRQLPYKVSEHGLVNKTGHAFIYKFDVPPKHIEDISEEYGRDVDIARRQIFRVDDEPEKLECTLEDELQPPAYRKEVIRMMEIAKGKEKNKYPHKSGLDYYPFQR